MSPENWAEILVFPENNYKQEEGSSPSASATFLSPLFLMWSYLVKGGHSWSLNSLLSFSDFLTTIPTQTYGPEMSPENYLVSHFSIIPTGSVELNNASVIGGEFDF